MKEGDFTWTKFYMKFADALLKFKGKRAELLKIIRESYDALGMKYPFMEGGAPIDDICPFTVFGTFNKGITDTKRIAIIREYAKKMQIETELPNRFDGIPVLNPMMAWFFAGNADRNQDDISNLWALFEKAIWYADEPSEETRMAFIYYYDTVTKQRCIKWNITVGLFWIRPFSYLNLDSCNRQYLLDSEDTFSAGIRNTFSLKNVPSAITYLELVDACKVAFKENESPFNSFPGLSYNAWLASRKRPSVTKETSTAGINPNKIRYWLYAPGENSRLWDEFFGAGIMGIGWDEMGDLKQYPSKEAMKERLKELYGQESSPIHSALATWQFANEISPGDIVYAKKGMYKVVGRGIVESGYYFDRQRKEYMHLRRIRWTHDEELDYPGKPVMKVLTDITPYTECVQKLESLFLKEPYTDKQVSYPEYSDEDFLREVFMEPAHYETLKNLLRIKKNIILQGPPGVGKTFAAKRLAYSIMGEKDTSRVLMVQFHQSYCYEDFVMGYRPTKDGFELTPGPFYEFCKKTQDDNEREYFFIIDEINRGNLSKIFGELMMLIEADKRGEEMRLLYSNELFSVPKKLYIIGMMNTADRSLAMIDYALRRRFAFFTMEPAFDSDGFKAILDEVADPNYTALVELIKELNEFISNDDSLGEGFRIGHSYLCPEMQREITDEWLYSVVEHELIPLLNEYWFDEQDKIRQWAEKLRGVLK